MWLDPDRARRAEAHRRRTWSRALREQNSRSPRARSASRPPPTDQPYQLAVRAQGRLVEPEEFERDRRPRAAATASRARQGRRPRVELGARELRQLLRFNGQPRRRSGHLPAPRRQRAGRARRRQRGAGRLAQRFPPGLEYKTRYDTTLASRASIHEVVTHAGRSDRAGHPGHLPVPARLAQRAHHRAHPPGVAGRHVRLRAAVRASPSTR